MLEFPAPPSGVDPATIEVRLFGRDTKTDEYVECRVGHKALMDHCGASGTKDAELLRAFAESRQKIESAAMRKYSAGKFERKPDRILVRLQSEDF